MQNTDAMYIPMEPDQDFPKFLKRVRKEENVYLEQLAEGLMAVSQLARIEKGQRPIPKNMRDRLLGRLGIASDLYENLLNIEDYAAWEHQRNILHAIERREPERALELIGAYERQAPVRDKIKRQFCLMMTAEVLKLQKADQDEIAACYAAAVKCTVPDIEELCLERKLLSIQEINMILEYEYYHKEKDFADRCRELMVFVEHVVYDDLSKVKIYPKIVHYYLQETFERDAHPGTEEVGESLRICDQAIEMLRNTGRAFYLLELLEMKARLLESMGQQLQESEELRSAYQECTQLADLFRKLSAEYSVPAYMRDCVYLYQQRWVFYIGDVLRIRREMYGLTQKELCSGICSVKTLRRAEKKESNMQQAYLGVLLRRLGLSKEFQRARLVTDDREVLRLRREISTSRNNQDYVKCRELLSQIKEKISVEIPENRQFIMELEVSLDWMENKITKEEFVSREEEALQCTLCTQRFLDADKIYLTELELLCIRKIIQGIESSKKRKYINFLLRFFDLYEKKYMLSDCIVMYEYNIIFAASELANIGEYKAALELDTKVLGEDLARRRVWLIGNILYDILWTKGEQQRESGQLVNAEKMTEYLEQCKLFSHFCKQTFYEKFYEEKLHQS